MMGVLEKIPYLDPYSNPIYFVYLIFALLPIIIGLFYRRRLPLYEFLVTGAFILMMFGQDHTSQLIAFLIYVVWQTVCVFSYKWYRKRNDHFIVFALALLLIILPLFFVKLSPFNQAHPNQSLFSF